jgi:hypothetical protein
MQSRVAWGLAVLLAVLLLGGAGIGLQHTYAFCVMMGGPGGPIYGSSPPSPGAPPTSIQWMLVGDKAAWWWRRSR